MRYFIIPLLATGALVLSTAAASSDFSVTLVDDAAVGGYGTFQSHNQKLVHNANGIFVSHL